MLSPLFPPFTTESNLPLGTCFSASPSEHRSLGHLVEDEVHSVSKVYLNSGMTSGNLFPLGCLPAAADCSWWVALRLQPCFDTSNAPISIAACWAACATSAQSLAGYSASSAVFQEYDLPFHDTPHGLCLWVPSQAFCRNFSHFAFVYQDDHLSLAPPHRHTLLELNLNLKKLSNKVLHPRSEPEVWSARVLYRDKGSR